MFVLKKICQLKFVLFFFTSANNNDGGDSKAIIYILLDSLEELKTTIPATSSINIPHIINHIHVHLSNNDIV